MRSRTLQTAMVIAASMASWSSSAEFMKVADHVPARWEPYVRTGSTNRPGAGLTKTRPS